MSATRSHALATAIAHALATAIAHVIALLMAALESREQRVESREQRVEGRGTAARFAVVPLAWHRYSSNAHATATDAMPWGTR